MRTRITAYLRFEGFERKISLVERLPVIKIPVTLPLTISWLQEAFVPDSPNKHPIMVFEWRKQLTRFTHEYTLKDIER